MAKRSRADSFTPESSGFQVSEKASSPQPPAKVTIADTAASQYQPQLMRCSLPPHRDTLDFSSYEEYELHYSKTHVNRCSECGKNFPAQHILNIHIEENHDPIILARRDRGEKTFSCFVEGCERKCSTAQKRRRHLIDKHMFPRNYNFFIVNDGIDKQESLLRSSHKSSHNNNSHFRRVSLSLQQSPQEGRLRNRKTSVSSSMSAVHHSEARVEDPNTDEIDALTSSMSALKFVPASVSRRFDSDRKKPSG